MRAAWMGDESMYNNEVELGHYGRVFRRSWWMVVVAVVVGVVAALTFLPAASNLHESTVAVLLRPGDADLGRSSDPISEATEIGIARSALVGGGVVANSPIDVTLDEWQENLVVTSCLDGEGFTSNTDCDSQILEFTYRADTPETAVALVDLSATGYLNHRLEREQILRTSQLDDLNTQLADLDLRIANETAVLTAAEPESVAFTLSDLRLRRLENERIDLRSRLSVIEGVPVDVGSLLGGASSPLADSTGVPFLAAVLAGAIMGLMLGTFGAVLTDRLDRRLSSAAETEIDLGAPVLGDIPRITEDNPALVTALSPQSAGAEAFRRLAAAAIVPRGGSMAASITVTGAHDGEGRTSAAANLAIGLSQAGRSVVLVAADRRNTALDRLFALTSSSGLSDYLRTDTDLSTARELLDNAHDRLGIRVIPTGTGTPPPLSEHALAALIAAAREEDAVIVFDSPPALTHADGLLLASLADAVYVVASVGRTRRSELAELRIQLMNVDAAVVGSILNRTSRLSLLPAGAGNLGTSATTMPSTGEPAHFEADGDRVLRSLHNMGRTGLPDTLRTDASVVEDADEGPEDAHVIEDDADTESGVATSETES
ncbi:MAG: hypothetical protein ACR2P0_21120 [Acidimicrobiales bacterium]